MEEEMSQEEMQQLRQEVQEEIEAEEKGEPITHKDEEPETVIEPKVEDPFAGVDPAIKSIIDDMQGRLKQSEQRIGALTNDLYNAKKAAEGTAPTKEQLADVQSEEDWEQLKSEFPEWADATDKRMTSKIAAAEAKLRKELSGFKPPAGIDPTELQKTLVAFVHPDWDKTIATPEYATWLKSQPADLQAKTKSPLAVDAVAVLNAFSKRPVQKTAAEIAEERKSRMRTAVNPQGGKTKPIKSESDMNEVELRQTIGSEVWAT